MASFYAELHVEGRVYVVTRCRFSVHQPTGARGRPNAKVRQGPLAATLDRDADEFLTTWAATPHAPKTGHVIFYDIGQKTARETISFTAGHLVHLGEEFGPNGRGEIAYYANLVITAEKFELLAGAPANPAAIRPAPGSHGTPPLALTGVAPGLDEAIKQTVEPLLPLVLPDILATAVPYVAPVLTAAAGAAGVLALILATTTPAHAPGLPVPVADPDELRLRELAGKHADGTLTAEEEPELIALLAKVKGIRVQKLDDLLTIVPTPPSPATPLLPGEGEVGSYKDLINSGSRGDNLTPHHVPSDAYNKLHGVATDDGICINMEQPRKGGRHRRTKTYGWNMTPEEREAYYKLPPLEALEHDVRDVQRVYEDDGHLDPKMRENLRRLIEDNKRKFPHLYTR